MKDKLLCEFFRAFVILILATLLTACGKDKESPAPTSAPATPVAGTERITIIFACHDYELGTYEELVEQFEAANPTIHVRLISIEEILESDVREWPEDAARRVMSAADAASWHIIPLETQQGLIRNLTPFIEADATFQADDFYPGLLETFQWDGGAWSLPARVELILFFFDKHAFEAAGEPYPEPGWTWDDFLAKAEALTEREGDTVTRYGYVPAWGLGLLTSYLADHDAPLEDRSTIPPTSLLDSPAVAQAVAWYRDLVQAHQVMPYLSPQESGYQGRAVIEEGRAAMWTDFAANQRWQSQSFNLGVAPFPSDGKAGTTPIVVYGHVMSAGTTYPNEAWRWLNFLSHQGPVGWLAEAVPARRSTAEASGYWDELDEQVAAVYHYALNHALAQTRLVSSPTRWALEQAVEAILTDGQTVETALANAQKTASGGQSEQAPVAVTPVLVPPTPEPVAGEGEIMTITFIASGDLSAYRALAKDFLESHPKIVVQVRVPDYKDWYGVSELATDSDCFYGGGGVGADVTTHLLNLTPLLDAEPDFPRDDFYPVFWQGCEWEGDPWCLPFDGRVELVRYNKELFDAAGVPYPQPGWTMDDFLTTAVALTQGEGFDKQYGFANSYSESAGISNFVSRHGAVPWDYDASPPRPQFDAPEVVEALQWYADLARVHAVKPAVYASRPWASDEQAMSLLQSGRVAMWSELTGTYEIEQFVKAPTGVVPFPRGEGQETTWTIPYGFYISAQTEHPRACWEWVKFLSDNLELVRGVPARRSLVESAAFERRVGDEVAATYLYILEQSAAPIDPVPLWPGAWFYEAYDAILDGADAAQVLGEAQYKAEQYVLCLETKQDLNRKSRELACAQEVDPDYPLPPWEE